MADTITYFIGGIATDASLYSYPMQHIPGSVYLPFPEHAETDTLATYAEKLIPLIDTSKPFNIVANSMGGMMTMELSRHINPDKVILVSSFKCRAEMPWRLRQLRKSKLHRLMSGHAFITGVAFGSRFVREITAVPGLRQQVTAMARNNSPEFLHWCVNAIAHWQGDADYRSDIIHIHGTKDRMFPVKNISKAIPVKDGSHNMLLTRKEEITALLKKYLNIS